MCELENSERSTQILDSQARQGPWEESEGIYKPSCLQKGVMYSVYWEHGDEVDQFASAPATCQQLKYVHI
jgi:hypothetical protein